MTISSQKSGGASFRRRYQLRKGWMLSSLRRPNSPIDSPESRCCAKCSRQNSAPKVTPLIIAVALLEEEKSSSCLTHQGALRGTVTPRKGRAGLSRKGSGADGGTGRSFSHGDAEVTESRRRVRRFIAGKRRPLAESRSFDENCFADGAVCAGGYLIETVSWLRPLHRAVNGYAFPERNPHDGEPGRSGPR